MTPNKHKKSEGGFSVRCGGHHLEMPEECWTNGSEFLSKYLQFNKSLWEFDHYELKIIAFLGGMGYGKSSKVKSVMKFCVDSFGDDIVNYFNTDSVDLAVANADLKPLQVICIDDATTMNDSRLSGGKKRASQTHSFFIIRHEVSDKIQNEITEQVNSIDDEIVELKEELTNAFSERLRELHRMRKVVNRKAGGVIFLIFCFQHYGSLDVRYREFFDAIFLVSYSRSPIIQTILCKDKQLTQLLKDITKQNLYNNYEARNFCVGSTKVDDLLVLKTEYLTDAQFPIRFFSGASLRDEYISNLLRELLDLPISILSDSRDIIYGYFLNKYKGDREFMKFHIGKIEINEMIDEMKYLKRDEIGFFLEFGIDQRNIDWKQLIENAPPITFKDVMDNRQIELELICRLRNHDCTWEMIGEICGKKKATVHMHYKDHLAQLRIPDELKENANITQYDLAHRDPKTWVSIFKMATHLGMTIEELSKSTNCSKDFLVHQFRLFSSSV